MTATFFGQNEKSIFSSCLFNSVKLTLHLVSLIVNQVKEWRVVKKAEEKETEKKSEKFKYFYCF